MNSKIRIIIYRTVINEVSAKYEDTREFINKRLNELCSEHGISAEEVRLYNFMFVMLDTLRLAMYTVYRESFLHYNSFILKSKTYKWLKQHTFC